MAKFINPYTDTGFKKIFGQEVSKELLIDFLNALLEGERIIRNIAFLPTTQLPTTNEDREMIFDIYCTTDTGEHIIIEMQNYRHSNFKERSIYYVSRAIINQGVPGREWRFGIHAVYGIFLVGIKDSENQRLRTDVILSDRDTKELFSDKFREIFISLSNFAKEEYECESNLERWLYVLKNMKTLQRMPFKAQKAVFEKLESIADLAALSKEERAAYERELKIEWDRSAILDYAEQKGIKAGIEAGIEKGREEGRTEGREEGRTEGREEERLKNAQNFKQLGINAEIIAQATGLTLEEIEKL